MRAGTTSTAPPAEWAAVCLALERHQGRRQQGIPTLGVLIGPPETAAAVWQEWAQATGRTASIQNSEDGVQLRPGEAVLAVCRAASGDGLARAVEFLGRALEAAAGGRKTPEPIALTVDPAAAAAFLRDEPYSRIRTLFAEGLVTLPLTSSPVAGSQTPDPGTAAASLALAAPSLAKRALRPETAASFRAAAAAWRAVEAAPAGGEEIDRARSAAERFLFDLLGDLPETAGLFKLNVRLGFCFGPMPAEVDLLAAELRLAVEIDGFHHFRDPDGYRRDRRKDALLQRQGYLVLRVLAEDVVSRLEEILDEIRTAVAFRRATSGS